VEFYDLTVTAKDQGASSKSAQRTLRVGLTDVNDNVPKFAQFVYTYTFAEDRTIGM